MGSACSCNCSCIDENVEKSASTNVEVGKQTLASGHRDSEGDVWFDAIDRFPTDLGVMYPPTRSMRSSASNIDMQIQESFSLLLNSSARQIATDSSRSLRNSNSNSGAKTVRPSVRVVSDHLTTETPGTQGTGYPGDLTEEELETCLEFREQLKKKDPAFQQIVRAMHPHEHEAFSLCRFLRARNFDIDGVFAMLTEKNQVENWHKMKDGPNFHLDFHITIPDFNGCPLPVFLTQFPVLHSGIGKNGAIVLYAKVGRINCPGIECIVGDMTNAVPFVWNRLYHGSRNAMAREIASADPQTTTVLAEQIVVADLLGDSAIFTTGMNFLKASASAVSCFPENNNRTYVLNAPFSFSIVWAVLRQLLDPRTVSKIGFFSTIPKAKKDFMARVDSKELLSDYGGSGKSFDEVLAERQRELAHKQDIVRYVVETLAMNGRQIGFDFDLSSDETIDSIVVYSRSDNMCEISVVDRKRNAIVDYKNVSREQATSKASSPADAPDGGTKYNNYAVEIAKPGTFADDAKGPFFVNTKGGTKGDYFLVAISIAKK